jgi:hypothetical protein
LPLIFALHYCPFKMLNANRLSYKGETGEANLKPGTPDGRGQWAGLSFCICLCRASSTWSPHSWFPSSLGLGAAGSTDLGRMVTKTDKPLPCW